MIVVELDDKKVKCNSEILKRIYDFVQFQKSDTEAGGIIVGRENRGNYNIVLEYITEPMKNDVRTRTKFLRKDIGHLEYYKRLYDENDGVYAYYGEWHTHPEDYPNYSFVDLINWKKIAKNDPKEMQYHIIAGRKSLVIWRIRKGYLIPDKVCEVIWNEIFY